MESQIKAIMAQIKVEAREKGREKGAMSVNDIIIELMSMDQDKPIVISMKRPIYDHNWNISGEEDILVRSDFYGDSWRGSYDLPSTGYDELSENPSEDNPSDNDLYVTVEMAINQLKAINMKKVIGWKGGDFVLNANDILFIANMGESNDSIAITHIEEEDNIVVCYTNYDMY